ncbi:MAG: zinc ribbon domain-containing protein [Clostridia bacterium]|nr:zinc ribbon domain-containing protein [Clostridia bacterium]MBR5986651.1 zinc ribbon domain-containing protein [Clostridia bacterium]MBR6008401.1 zinc ribbon domain-containing protein [Clostridia bacterium]MBR6498813.1 zinc ribbon domain-containing protein [Clostridia bacterium]
MPLHQYRCTKCGHEFELLTTIDKRNEARCPKCEEKGERGWMGKAAFGPIKYKTPFRLQRIPFQYYNSSSRLFCLAYMPY